MKVYGFDVSNYYNIVKQVALETGFNFEPVLTIPGFSEDLPTLSPMGKVPVAVTDHGPLTETRAIVTYIGDQMPKSPLFPTEAWDRARIQELISIADLYIESQARRHIDEAVFSDKRDELAYQEVRPAVDKGMVALGKRLELSPYLLGEQYTVADIYVFHCLCLSREIMQIVYQWNLLSAVDGLQEWYDRIAAKETTSKVLADRDVAVKAMKAKLGI